MSISPVLLRRASRVAAVSAVTALLAACASAGATGGLTRTPSETRIAEAAPAVTDPAPIVSGTMRRYQVRGRWYQPEEQPNYDEVGLASWYGDQFNGRPTSTGERFDMHALTAAHKTLPLPGLVEVTNLANGRRVVLRVNDRGPFVDGRIIDLSRGAAEALDLLSRGVGEVRVRYLGRAPRLGGGTVIQTAEAASPPPVVAPPVSADQRYWIEVAAYRDQPQAQAIAGRIGRSARVQAASDQSMFRVLLGPWNDANAAERARQSVLADGFGGALLISAR
ncbi:septal ring lytic transglycosylase RlpA family protein [Brevundimonas sp. NIBR11]|uniref:septal ring lytic transglycosylase RlpA family protein n=1 Tax=Brevundimonas sp. NIBR11 TaxID=3015999 RepID=UPI0022EFE2CF|nr:septal ring lytic transglycosylase RlpA family protein [Brevundimonas sp. NIBR11]WGM31155.1 Endolytic peptidoglycan transglycosylase RlpA [Brevundimonas sp. NIBR11]